MQYVSILKTHFMSYVKSHTQEGYWKNASRCRL